MGRRRSTCPSRHRCSLEVFLIDRIIGEVPLDVYTITMADVLTEKELSDPNTQKEYYMERIDLNSKLIEANVNSDVINNVFKELDTRNRMMDIRSLVQTMLNNKVNKDEIIELLRSFGLSDSTITKTFVYVT